LPGYGTEEADAASAELKELLPQADGTRRKEAQRIEAMMATTNQ
jgi:hypothetical protein